MKSLFCFLAAVLLVVSAHGAERKPNIIVLFADDLGYGELGCQGMSKDIPTPHIDALARGGTRFTSGYVTAPFCSASRAGMLTGRYQTRFGHEYNPIGKQNLDPAIGLPVQEKTMGDRLKAAGYRTGLVGKWHLGGTEKYLPQNRGFDEFYGFLHEGHFYVPPPYDGALTFLRTNSLPFGERMTNGPVIWSNHLRGNEPPYDEDNPLLRGAKELVEPQYLTEVLTHEATGFIERNQKQPFFLYLAYNAVHSPMQATPKYLKRFAHIEDVHRRIFAAMLAALDDSVGEVMAKVKALNLEEDTLIFFLSDNGGPTQELTSSNAPLRGGKGQLFEGGIRVPFMAQWKGMIPAGKVYEQPVISLDIQATSLAVAQATATGESKLDGVNLLPFLRGEKASAPHELLFWRVGGNVTVRSGDWKLVRQQERGGGKPEFQLYNLAKDIGETLDLKATEPKRAASLLKQLETLNDEMIEPVWGGPKKK